MTTGAMDHYGPPMRQFTIMVQFSPPYFKLKSQRAFKNNLTLVFLFLVSPVSNFRTYC